MNIEELGITKEDLIDKAAQKIADEIWGDTDPESMAREMICKRINEISTDKMIKAVETTLSDAMEKILDEEVVPRDIFGDKKGEPTTIRATLAERARNFWDTKVDRDGRVTNGYGGEPRSTHLMRSCLTKTFDEALKANIDEVVKAFKESVKAELHESISQNIDRMLK